MRLRQSGNVRIGDRKATLSRADGAVGGDDRPTDDRRFAARSLGVEDEKRPIAAAEEHVAARHARIALESEHLRVKALGGVEIGRVEAGFSTRSMCMASRPNVIPRAFALE